MWNYIGIVLDSSLEYKQFVSTSNEEYFYASLEVNAAYIKNCDFFIDNVSKVHGYHVSKDKQITLRNKKFLITTS